MYFLINLLLNIIGVEIRDAVLRGLWLYEQ